MSVFREDLEPESGWAGQRGMAPAAGSLGFTPYLPWRHVLEGLGAGGARAGDVGREDQCLLCLAGHGIDLCPWGLGAAGQRPEAEDQSREAEPTGR